MRLLARPSLRLFLITWILFSIHFATNIVREHYPAFSLSTRGDFVLDAYDTLHSDIFLHSDGHHYICNQVGTSVLAAVPLLLATPLLDALQRHREAQLADDPVTAETTYRTDYPMRAAFLRETRARGLDLRFGAAAAITAVFFMAPLSALGCALFFVVLRARGVARRRSVLLTLLLALATPVLYRTAHLSGNQLLAWLTFGAFLCVWPFRRAGGEEQDHVSTARRFLGGLLAGYGLFVDYAGALLLPALFAYVVLARVPRAGWRTAVRESAAFFLGTLPGVALLLGTQWAMFGDPFLPAQAHMPAAHFTEEGWRGMGLPRLDLFFANLLDWNWGLVPYGPLLVLAVLPLRAARGGAVAQPGGSVLPARERRLVWAYTAVFLLFCAGNNYARMQWNTGFRYLAPLVPLLFLASCDHLARWRERWVWAVGAPALAHSWVLAMTRYTVPSTGGEADGNAVLESWRIVLREGVRLPWLHVLRSTSGADDALVQWPGWPYVVVLLAVGACWGIWRLGERAEARLGRAAEA